MIICPGGGYQWHSPREAKPVARAFAARGWKPW
ncbi:MAG TPA: acetyl esterase, partial [Candidatus Ventrisoma faecale]|nr:acetyl esterase [Candidatus Ventrisoma faecale]